MKYLNAITKIKNMPLVSDEGRKLAAAYFPEEGDLARQHPEGKISTKVVDRGGWLRTGTGSRGGVLVSKGAVLMVLVTDEKSTAVCRWRKEW